MNKPPQVAGFVQIGKAAQLIDTVAGLGGFVNAGGLDNRLHKLLNPGHKAGFEKHRFFCDNGLFYAALIVLYGLALDGVFHRCTALDITGAVFILFNFGIVGNFAGKLYDVQVTAAQDDLFGIVDSVCGTHFLAPFVVNVK